jgi:hypothetical protein
MLLHAIAGLIVAEKHFNLKSLKPVFLRRCNPLQGWEQFLEGWAGMLIISRKKDQKIIVADDIEITILEVGRNRVRFGIKAPKHIPIQTRLKDTPGPEKTTSPVGVRIEPSTSSLVDFSAAVSLAKRR